MKICPARDVLKTVMKREQAHIDSHQKMVSQKVVEHKKEKVVTKKEVKKVPQVKKVPRAILELDSSDDESSQTEITLIDDDDVTELIQF